MENNEQELQSEVFDKKLITEELLEALRKAENIDVFLKENMGSFNDIKFNEYLNNIMTARGLKKATVIKASGLSETFAYQIFSGYKHPSRDKLLALAVAMRMTYAECQKLLMLAGVNVFYAKNRRDAIIIFALDKGLSVPQLNDILFELEEFTL